MQESINVPFSRPFTLRRLPQNGFESTIKATPEECETIARDLKMEGLKSLQFHYVITGDERRARLKGVLEARVIYACVLTLEPFEASVREELDLTLREEGYKPSSEDEDYEIVANGAIDLGTVMCEFLALALEPYPKKPVS